MTVWPNGTKNKPTISSGFGPRYSPGGGISSYHRGADMVGFSTICAVEAGTVIVAGTRAGWTGGGQMVWIQHQGWVSRSLHMIKGSILVRTGQAVSEGQALGRMGMTGTATGVHLHFEAVVNNVQIDPVPFLTNRVASTAGGGGSTPFPGGNDLGTLDNTEANYQVFASFMARALRYDVRVNGFGTSGALGNTIWERLNQVQSTAAASGVTDAQVKAIADAVIAQIKVPAPELDYAKIAKSVNDDAAVRRTSWK